MLSTKELNEIPVSKGGDLFCDDYIIESFNNNSSDEPKDLSHTFHIPDTRSNLCLLGDSHMGCYSFVLQKLQMNHSGGFLMNGSAWRRALFRLDDSCFLLPYESLESQKKWCQLYESFFKDRKNSDCTLLTNISNHLHAVPAQLEFYVKNFKDSKKVYPLPEKDILKDFINWSCRLNFQLLERFLNDGLNVIVITDPPFQHLGSSDDSKNESFYVSIDNELSAQLSSLGCKVINTRKWTNVFLEKNTNFNLERFKEFSFYKRKERLGSW